MVAKIQQAQEKVDTMIDEAHDTVVDLADRAERGAEATTDSAGKRVKKQARAAGDYVRDKADEASRGGHQHVADAAETITRKAERTKRNISRVATATTNHVAKSPFTSMILVGLIGFLLGMLVGWRRD